MKLMDKLFKTDVKSEKLEVKMTPSDICVLFCIEERVVPITQIRLFFGWSNPNVYMVTGRLEDLGFLKKKHIGDNVAKSLVITSKGKQLLKKIREGKIVTISDSLE